MVDIVMVCSVYMGVCMLLEEMVLILSMILLKFMILTVTNRLCYNTNLIAMWVVLELVLSRNIV